MTRRKLQEVGDTFFYSVACEVGQYAVAMLFGLLVLSPLFPDLPPGFAILLPIGWAGGHGTAAAVGSVLEAGGWPNALPLAYTSATAGVAFALVGGMSLIHLAIRKGWTQVHAAACRHAGEFPDRIHPCRRTRAGGRGDGERGDDRHAYLAPGDRRVRHRDGVCGVRRAAQRPRVPAVRVRAADRRLVLRFVFTRARLETFIDVSTIRRIGGTATDYLVGFGVASIAVTVVLEYAVPLGDAHAARHGDHAGPAALPGTAHVQELLVRAQPLRVRLEHGRRGHRHHARARRGSRTTRAAPWRISGWRIRRSRSSRSPS